MRAPKITFPAHPTCGYKLYENRESGVGMTVYAGVWRVLIPTRDRTVQFVGFDTRREATVYAVAYVERTSRPMLAKAWIEAHRDV